MPARLRPTPLLLLFLGLLAGCDRAAPAAFGTVALGAGVEASNFSSLQLRAYHDTGFNPTQVDGEDSNTQAVPLSTITFPYRYNLGGAVGTSESSRWRFTAWLAQDADATVIEPGDVYCSQVFDLRSCGASGGYCGNIGGVDCTLETVR